VGKERDYGRVPPGLKRRAELFPGHPYLKKSHHGIINYLHDTVHPGQVKDNPTLLGHGATVKMNSGTLGDHGKIKFVGQFDHSLGFGYGPGTCHTGEEGRRLGRVVFPVLSHNLRGTEHVVPP
jgi:hypothetical protein